MKFSLRFLAIVCALMVSVSVALASGGGGHGEKKEKAKAPKKARAITSLESWVMIDPFIIAIIQDGRIRGRFTISFGMDVTDGALREKAEELMPRLRDAWLNDLSLYAATTLRPRKAADVAGVSTLLQGIADRVLGKAGCRVLMAHAKVEMGS